MSRLAIPFLTAALAFGGAALAQTAVVREWTGATFENAVLGEFLGNYRPVAIVVRGGSLHYVFEPGRQAGFGAVTCIRNGLGTPLTGVTGLVNYRPTGLPDTAGDVLLIATTSGVYRGQFVAGATESVLVYAPCTNLGSIWNGASALAARNRPNSSVVDIAARSAAGDWAVFASEDAGVVSTNTMFADRHSVNPITAVHFLDWDANGAIEPVVVTTAGSGVGVSQGEVVIDCPANLTTAKTIPVTYAGQDQLGIIWNGLAAPQYSALWGVWSCSPLQRIDLPTGGLSAVGQIPTGVATYDMEGNGGLDMVVSRRGDFKHWFAGDLGFLGSVNVVPGAVGTPSQNLAPFFWKDFNFDGAPDLLAFWNSGIVNGSGNPTKAVIFKKTMLPTIPGGNQPYPNPPLVPSSVSAPPVVLVTGAEYYPSSTSVGLKLAAVAPFYAANRSVQVTVWLQPNPYLDPVVPDAAINPQQPLLDGNAFVATQAVPFTPGLEGTFTAVVPLVRSLPSPTTPDWQNRVHAYLDVRVIDTQQKKVVYAEVVGLLVYSQDSNDKWEDEHPDGSLDGEYDEAMTRYLMTRRINTNIYPMRWTVGGAAPSSLLGGAPIGVILPQLDIPPSQPKLPSVF